MASSGGTKEKAAAKPARAAKPKAEGAAAEKKPAAKPKASSKKDVKPGAPTASPPAAPEPVTPSAPSPQAAAPARTPATDVAAPPPAPGAVAVAQPESAPAEAAAPEVDDGKRIVMKPPIVVKDLAARMNCKSYQIIHDLMEMNIFAALTQSIEPDVARKVAEKRGFLFETEKREAGGGVHKPVEEEIKPPEREAPAKSDLQGRAPIITFMGHVDHGKTSLLDAIRRTHVADGEAGGITQHIGACQIERNGQKITFLDTPGHAAFSQMRARGANLTDIVVLVVAADDGMMPQTLEALAHAKAAGVKILVAINKIDLPGADPNRVKGQLREQGLEPEEWGGETIVCEVSATRRTGVDRLLENMLVLAEVMEIQASPKGFAKGSVVEAQIEQGRGATATVMVQSGTLSVGDAFICGDFCGKVKAMLDDQGRPVKSAGPSTPVKVVGFTGVPNAGDAFEVMKNEREAKALSDQRLESKRLGKLQGSQRVTLENLFETMAAVDRKVLRLVLKADVQGSVEAIATALGDIKSDKVSMEIILKGVGPITESDILLAAASNAVVIGFNTRTEPQAASAAKRETVQIKLYSIIYELIDQVKEAMAGLLDPVLRESPIGTAVVKQVIRLSKFPVAGCAVQSGRISKSARARVVRGRQPIYDGGIVTLKRFQDDVNEVRQGLECGVRLGDFNDYEPGDLIECYQLEKLAQGL